MVKQGKTAQECMRNREQLPLQCQHLLSSFVDCKRGMVSGDSRRRGGRSQERTSGRLQAAGFQTISTTVTASRLDVSLFLSLSLYTFYEHH
jgi:cytochrome c oxidase assembly factor 5